MATIYQTNFRAEEFMLFSAASAVIYSAVVTKYQLLSQTTLRVQMGALALTALAGCQILGTKRPEKQYFCAAVPLLILGMATLFTKETWKTKVISSSVLSASQLALGRICTEVITVPLPPTERSKPIVESRALGSISVEEMNRDEHQIRGFDKMVQGPWLEKQLQAICSDKAHFVDSVYASNNHTILDLDALLPERDIPTVVLINRNNHYSIVVYEPTEKKVYRFNSLSTAVNNLEQKVIDKMQQRFSVDEVVKNKVTPQKNQDGWSCAFHVMYFLEHFLNNSSMDDVDIAPLPQESLARRLATYYHFLNEVQTKVPESHKLYFELSLEEKDVSQLKNLMKVACGNGWVAKRGEQDSQNQIKQIECILIKLWLIQRQSESTFMDFVKEMGDFTSNERRFLSLSLNQMEWSRDAIVGLFHRTYFSHYNHPVSPN